MNKSSKHVIVIALGWMDVVLLVRIENEERLMEPGRWRLLYSGEAVGAWNMALDEAILEAVGRGESPPTLRLFAWSPPCLSIGYSQPVADVDSDAVDRYCWHLVRRPTGGRAILHTDELTYSVIAPLHEPRVAGSVLESYRRLSVALVESLRMLGISVQANKEYPTTVKTNSGGPVCFDVPSNYEITVDGKKLIGSAQARRMGGVLQHGSLPLGGDLTRITLGLAYKEEAARRAAASRLLERATTVEMILKRTPDWKAAADFFVDGFSRALNLTFEAAEPTAYEIERARELAIEKYASDRWTNKL
jgi:lipoyl(octanoyl) transferase